jgi:glycosyltransferase involved in cell wall biosynthesis
MTESTAPRRATVLFLNRSYWPDAEATGQLLTELCEDLAASFDVTVLAGQPNDNPTAAPFCRAGTEIRHGVRIRRVRHTRFPKRFLPGRLVNYLTFLVAALWAAIWAKRPDIVVVETDPPLLCLIGRYLQQVRGARLVVYLQDIHPDIAVAIGKLRDGRLVRALRKLMFRIYRGADRVVVLSRDMRERVVQSGVAPDRVVCVPNWIDTALVRPLKQDNPFRRRHDLNGQFVAMYSGNLGLCQRLEDVVAAAGYLRHRKDILFLLVGEGALKQQLEEQVARMGLPNVRFLPYQPKAHLAESLSAADVHLVPLDPRVASCLMPSKLYGVLASGTPLVAVVADECELAELTRRYGVGLVAPPGEPEALADVLARLADQTWDLPEMGARARRLAETEYDRRHVTSRFEALLEEILGTGPTVASAAATVQRPHEPQARERG